MIPDEERGLGLWFLRQREKRGYKSARELLEAVRAKTGAKIHLSEYSTLEGHGRIDTKRPKWIADQIAAFYGEQLPSTPTPAGQGMAELVKALTRQTEVMERLVEKLDTLASQAVRDGVADALREVALLQAAAASQSGQPPGPTP